MKAIVVYESLWGNTAAIARAIAEGIGADAQALSTAEATATAIADADLIVAGAPVLAFRLPSEQIRESIRVNPGKVPAPPDLYRTRRCARGSTRCRRGAGGGAP
jgi:biotin carboxylase